MKNMPQPSDKNTASDDATSAAPMTDLAPAELPDAQSLADAIKHWQAGDDNLGDDIAGGSDSGEVEVPNADANPWGGAKSDTKSGANHRADGGAKSGAGTDAKSGAKNEAGKKAPAAKRVSRNQSRRFARQRALQALYQWDVGTVDVSDVLNQFKENQNLSNVDLDHFERLFRGVALSVDDIDVHLKPALDRPITDLDPIERSILRLSACELRDCLQTPARVAINEAVELAKRFGADQGHKYVNGVIDKVAMALRETEMKAGKKKPS